MIPAFLQRFKFVAALAILPFGNLWAVNADSPNGYLHNVSMTSLSVSSSANVTGTLTVTSTAAGVILGVSGNANGVTSINLLNNSGGTGARAENTVTNGTSTLFMSMPGVSYTTNGQFQANTGLIRVGSNAAGLIIDTAGSTAPIVFATGDTERMRISGSLVGIGVVTPTARLEVSGPVSATGLSIVSSTAGAIGSFNSNVNGTTGVYMQNDNSGTGALAQFTAGNGTTSVTLAMPGVSFTTSGFFWPNYGLLRSGANADGLIVGAASGSLILGTNSIERARIVSGGSMGIAISTPTTALEVSGTISSTFITINKTSVTPTTNGSVGFAATASNTLCYISGTTWTEVGQKATACSFVPSR